MKVGAKTSSVASMRARARAVFRVDHVIPTGGETADLNNKLGPINSTAKYRVLKILTALKDMRGTAQLMTSETNNIPNKESKQKMVKRNQRMYSQLKKKTKYI